MARLPVSNIYERPVHLWDIEFSREAHLGPVPLLILSDLLGRVCAMASIHLCLTSPGPRVHLPLHAPTGAY